MASEPMALVRGAFPPATTKAWLVAIDAHPAWLRRDAGLDAAFNVHSSSLRLSSIPSLDAAVIANDLLGGPTGAVCSARLGDAVACNVDACWVRRQYAPSRYPPGHSAHAWHQDGALGFDFLRPAQPPGADQLLAMLTCWIALTPCGADAPGLEWIDAETPGLLPPGALRDEAVRAAHDAADFRRPVMRPGDCLAFGGNVLHHTHASPSMRHDRTSLEIRLFDASRIPERLVGDRFVALHRPFQRTSQ